MQLVPQSKTLRKRCIGLCVAILFRVPLHISGHLPHIHMQRSTGNAFKDRVSVGWVGWSSAVYSAKIPREPPKKKLQAGKQRRRYSLGTLILITKLITVANPVHCTRVYKVDFARNYYKEARSRSYTTAAKGR